MKKLWPTGLPAILYSLYTHTGYPTNGRDFTRKLFLSGSLEGTDRTRYGFGQNASWRVDCSNNALKASQWIVHMLPLRHSFGLYTLTCCYGEVSIDSLMYGAVKTLYFNKKLCYCRHGDSSRCPPSTVSGQERCRMLALCESKRINSAACCEEENTRFRFYVFSKATVVRTQNQGKSLVRCNRYRCILEAELRLTAVYDIRLTIYVRFCTIKSLACRLWPRQYYWEKDGRVDSTSNFQCLDSP